MKEQTIKQQLANAMRRMKPKGDSEAQKKLLKEVKAHIRNKFNKSVDYQIIVAPIKPYTALARLAVLLVLSAARRLV